MSISSSSPARRSARAALEAALAERLERWLFSRDERRVEELVLSFARARGLRLATAESCTGGMVAARLTSVAGSSESFVGGVVSYADEVKRSELDVPETAARTSTAPSPPRSQGRWRRARGGGSAPTWPWR